MDPVSIALLAGGSLLGGLLGRDKSKQRTSNRSTSTPTFDPAFIGVRDRLLRGAMRGPSGFDRARNITNTRLSGISDAGQAAETGLRARLAAMGQKGPAAGAAVGALGSRIFGEQVGAINAEPLLAHDLDMEQLDQLLSVLQLGRGQTTVTEGTGEASSGGGIGQGFGDLGEMLGWLAASGRLNLGGRRARV